MSSYGNSGYRIFYSSYKKRIASSTLTIIKSICELLFPEAICFSIKQLFNHCVRYYYYYFQHDQFQAIACCSVGSQADRSCGSRSGARALIHPPCDLSKSSFCVEPGESYPWLVTIECFAILRKDDDSQLSMKLINFIR